MQARHWKFFCAGLALAVATAPLPAQTNRRVSVDWTGHEAGAGSFLPVVSADGRYVAFESNAALVPGDTNGVKDIYVHDLQTGETVRVSVSSTGAEADALCDCPSISADGALIAFESRATTLVPGDTNGVRDVFVHDRRTGQTRLVSVSSAGVLANGISYEAALSPDGRFVAFASGATNLVAGDTNQVTDVFLRDLQAGVTVRVSLASTGAEGDAGSTDPSVAAGGRRVAFRSDATNLVPGDTNGKADIFVRDLVTGQIVRASVSSSGGEAGGRSRRPVIAADGSVVAFESFAANLVPGDTNGREDVFVHDLGTGQTTRVSVTSSGAEANGQSGSPALSADGRFVAFESTATNLHFGDMNGVQDVFLHDRQTGQTVRLSQRGLGRDANGRSSSPSLTADATLVAFSSLADDLVFPDINGVEDVFVYGRRVMTLSVSPPCPGWVNASVTGANPGAPVVFFWGDPVATTIGTGLPCAGTVVGVTPLGRPSPGYVLDMADQSGTAVAHTANMPASACGRIYLQAIDLSDCTTSGRLRF